MGNRQILRRYAGNPIITPDQMPYRCYSVMNAGAVMYKGKVLLVLNQEIRVPVTRRLGVVGFVDAGNTFTGLDTFSFGDLRVGVGAGLRIETPVAVLRLDVAKPVPPPIGSPWARWYLSIGQAF